LNPTQYRLWSALKIPLTCGHCVIGGMLLATKYL
jgi:hypothetical protein